MTQVFDCSDPHQRADAERPRRYLVRVIDAVDQRAQLRRRDRDGVDPRQVEGLGERRGWMRDVEAPGPVEGAFGIATHVGAGLSCKNTRRSDAR